MWLGVSVGGCWLDGCAVGGWWWGGCLDGYFGMCVVFRWMYEWKCSYVGGFCVDVWMDVS